MKPILTIGYNKFLLPNTSGLQTIIKILATAVELEHDWDRHDRMLDEEFYYVRGPVKIKFTMVPEKCIRATKTEKEPIEVKAEPQKHLNHKPQLLLPEG